MIWSKERDWERYVAEEGEFPAFILHRKSDSERICNKLCLDFEPYKNNRVNIFCDSSFADGMGIAKSDLEKICDE